MTKFVPYLIDHDQFLLHVWLQIGDYPKDVVGLIVRDRFGLSINQRQLDHDRNYIEINLGKVPRDRFPLFASGTDEVGKDVSSFKFGPIFYSPTDQNYSGGFPLPRNAIDTLNDPVIRHLQKDAIVANNRLRNAVNAASRYDTRVDLLNRYLTVPLLSAVICSVGAYLVAVFAAQHWKLWPLAIVTLLFLGLSIVLIRRLKTESASASAAAKEVFTAQASFAALEAKLITFGASCSSLKGTTSCGCSNKLK